MFALYGNQYEDREEHLLLSMFEVYICAVVSFRLTCIYIPSAIASSLGGGGVKVLFIQGIYITGLSLAIN